MNPPKQNTNCRILHPLPQVRSTAPGVPYFILEATHSRNTALAHTWVAQKGANTEWSLQPESSAPGPDCRANTPTTGAI